MSHAVALEDPNYPGALDTFNHARARLVPIPVTAHGAHVERLREAVVRESPRLIYLVPSFHNPTGTLMPEADRLMVARLAADTATRCSKTSLSRTSISRCRRRRRSPPRCPARRSSPSAR